MRKKFNSKSIQANLKVVNKMLKSEVRRSIPEELNPGGNVRFTTDNSELTGLSRYLELDMSRKFDPASFVQAWSVKGKTNSDRDREVVANLMGNGNNLTLYNFAFAEESGYGLYPIAMPEELAASQPFGTLHFTADTPSKFAIKQITSAAFTLKFTISGFKSKNKLVIRVDNSEGEEVSTDVYDEDGTYTFSVEGMSGSNALTFMNGDGSAETRTDFYMTIIPDYEGYLVTDGVDDTILSKFFDLGKDFTVIGEWEFLDNIKVGAGIVKAYSLFVYNIDNGLRIRINSQGEYPELNTKSLKAICSDGRVYSDDWSETLIDEEQTVTSSGGAMLIAHNGSAFTKFALKNLAFYDRVLSQRECIEAYNYLQTL